VNSQPVAGYKVFAALHDETDKGWVWASGGKQSRSRTTTLVTRMADGKKHSVYCEYREIDKNFVLKYDRADLTRCMYFPSHGEARSPMRADVDLSKLGKVIVINEWYRNKLCGFGTAARGARPQELCFDKPRFEWWGDLRAACQHPEPGVRVATRIAIVGTWFGITALLPAIVEADPLKALLVQHCIRYPAAIAFALCLRIGVPLTYCAGWKK